MKSLGENKKIAGLLIALLIFLIGFALYTYLLLPMKEQKSSLQYQISDMQSQIKDSKNQLKNMKSNQQASSKSNAELQLEVPTNRELSSLINSIEQVESVSKTNVVDIAFNNYDAAVKETINTDPANGQATNATNQNQATDPTQTAAQNATVQNNTSINANQATTTGQNQTGTENQTPVSPIASSSLPDSLKLLTMNLTVEATDKKEIKQFLEEIEILPRIMRIDAVSYDTPNTEVAASSTDPNTDQLQATIQLTTFYYVGQLDDQNKTQVN
ncbi:hypothetical protein ACWV26_13740 [Rummeliibacillus sp. JY-2-4R]